MIHHFLKEYGAKVTKQSIEKCLETVVEYNPWFLEEGSLDEETWVRVKNNVLKAPFTVNLHPGLGPQNTHRLLWTFTKRNRGSCARKI